KVRRTYSKPTIIEQEKRFWIACLFTSYDYGKNVNPPESILKATVAALYDLDLQIQYRRNDMAKENKYLRDAVRTWKATNEISDDHFRTARVEFHEAQVERAVIGECYAVKINSGLFGIPWEKTKDVLIKGNVNMVVIKSPDKGEETKTTEQVRSSYGTDGTDESKEDVKRMKMMIELMAKHIRRTSKHVKTMKEDIISLRNYVNAMKEDILDLRNERDCRASRPMHGMKRKVDETGMDEYGFNTKKQSGLKFEKGEWKIDYAG
ncbi:MAG: hypothetical protein Q9228_008016, partial [Teloschistes exilis]